MNDHQLPLFLTTAIPYVNAAPHVGHAFELLIADALARHYRQRGRPVRLTGGTDDHSSKNARAADARGISTRDLVREHGDTFRRLQPALGVTVDDYLHTSRDPRHRPAVHALWLRCGERGDLYTKEYTGRYCSGCEAFVQPADLVEGCCPAHRLVPEEVTERNWFFRLSRYESLLSDALSNGSLRVLPRERHNEITSFARSGLLDFSVSRDRARCRDWGIEVPGDDTQVIYVWFDALANYLALLGFPEATADISRFWGAAAAAREHLIGKDILRFHALYWPAILASAGLPLPTTIRVHGFVTAEGEKIGKSLGNAVDPFDLVERYGQDAVRFYLLRHLHTIKDSDFRAEKLREAHDTELAGKLGNLLQRSTAIGLRHPSLRLRPASVESPADRTLREAAARALTDVQAAVDDFALHHALACIVDWVGATNRYADACEPWTLSRSARTATTAQETTTHLQQLAHVLWHLLEALRVTAVLLAPFLPSTAARIAARLGLEAGELDVLDHARFGNGGAFELRAGGPLFPRFIDNHGETPGPVSPNS